MRVPVDEPADTLDIQQLRCAPPACTAQPHENTRWGSLRHYMKGMLLILWRRAQSAQILQLLSRKRYLIQTSLLVAEGSRSRLAFRARGRVFATLPWQRFHHKMSRVNVAFGGGSIVVGGSFSEPAILHELYKVLQEGGCNTIDTSSRYPEGSIDPHAA